VRASSIWQSVVEHAPEQRRLVLQSSVGRAPVERYGFAWIPAARPSLAPLLLAGDCESEA
jgi:hypothetical protein